MMQPVPIKQMHVAFVSLQSCLEGSAAIVRKLLRADSEEHHRKRVWFVCFCFTSLQPFLGQTRHMPQNSLLNFYSPILNIHYNSTLVFAIFLFDIWYLQIMNVLRYQSNSYCENKMMSTCKY